MISILAIFSSTSLLRQGDKDRMDFISEHLVVVGIGLGLIFGLYNIKKIGLFRVLSQLGFGLSAVLLSLLALHVRIPGVIEAERINGAWRTLNIAGFQMHVFEVVKVAMVLYLAWAIHGNKEKRLKYGNTDFQKRLIYMYAPILIVCVLTLMGSGSSAVFIGAILIATLLIGGMPFKEIALAGVAGIAALLQIVGEYNATGGTVF